MNFSEEKGFFPPGEKREKPQIWIMVTDDWNAGLKDLVDRVMDDTFLTEILKEGSSEENMPLEELKKACRSGVHYVFKAFIGACHEQESHYFYETKEAELVQAFLNNVFEEDDLGGIIAAKFVGVSKALFEIRRRKIAINFKKKEEKERKE